MELIVGQILRPHGIRGELLVDVRTDEPAQRFAVGSVLITDSTAVRRTPAPKGAESSPVPGAGAGTGTAESPVPAGVRWTLPPTLTIAAVRPHQGRLIV